MATISKYQKGKIYKIITENSNDVYIGSTTATLRNRLSHHKSHMKGGGFCSSSIVLRQGNYTIELITDYPCNSKTELVREEGKYQREMDCVNTQIAGRTQSEWYVDNKEHKNAKSKENWEKNKEADKERHRENYKKDRENYIAKASVKCSCICGSDIRHDGKSKHLKSIKHKKYLLTLNNVE